MDRFFKIAEMNRLEPGKGRLLISEPFLEDCFFKRSVVYLCEHNDEGSFGFVLNNILSVDLSEVIPELSDLELKVCFGGPVNSNNLYFLHDVTALKDAQKISSGLYIGGDFNELCQMISMGVVEKDRVRFFLGYSGWSAGQLKEELAQNSWIVACSEQADINVLKLHDEKLWKSILEDMGGKFKVISNFPADPTLN